MAEDPGDEHAPAKPLVRDLASRAELLAEVERLTPKSGRPVVYLAAPVSAPTIDGVRANLARAKRWLWALRCATDWSICAPWIPAVEAALDSGAAEHDERARGLVDDVAVVERCDAVVGCGGRWSSGMLIEGHAARSTIDLTPIGEEPPAADVLRAYIETLCGESMRARSAAKAGTRG